MITQGIAHILRYKEYFNPQPYRSEQDGVVMLHAFGKRHSWQPDLEMCTCMIDRLNLGLNAKWRVSFAIKRTLDLKLDKVKPLSPILRRFGTKTTDQNQNYFFFHSYLRKLAADFMCLCCVGLLITYLSSVAKLSVATTRLFEEYNTENVVNQRLKMCASTSFIR